MPLESIARIEVIRGPALAFGEQTPSTASSTSSAKVLEIRSAAHRRSTEGRWSIRAAMVRYGGPSVGNHGAYRVFADGFEMGHFLTPDHQSGKDDWYRFHGGFRADEDVSAEDSLTMEGEAIRGNAGAKSRPLFPIFPPVKATLDLRDRFSGWSVLGAMEANDVARSETSLQAYFDRSDRGDTAYGSGLNTFDARLPAPLSWGRRHDLVGGLGYRLSSDAVATTPDSRRIRRSWSRRSSAHSFRARSRSGPIASMSAWERNSSVDYFTSDLTCNPLLESPGLPMIEKSSGQRSPALNEPRRSVETTIRYNVAVSTGNR